MLSLPLCLAHFIDHDEKEILVHASTCPLLHHPGLKNLKLILELLVEPWGRMEVSVYEDDGWKQNKSVKSKLP